MKNIMENQNSTSYTITFNIACIGDSITKGYGLPNPEDSYPAKLQQLMGGERYLIRNFGVNGATVLRSTPSPYAITMECEAALDWDPDIAVIELGANDIPYISGQEDNFIFDYRCIIEAFMAQNTQVCLASLTPVLGVYGINDNDLKIRHQKIQGLIGRLAKTYSLPMIDIWSPINNALTSNPYVLQDGIHPTEIGANILANSIYSIIESIIDTPLRGAQE